MQVQKHNKFAYVFEKKMYLTTVVKLQNQSVDMQNLNNKKNINFIIFQRLKLYVYVLKDT